MRAIGKRSVLCVAAFIAAVSSAHATTACAAQKAGKIAKPTDGAAAPVDKKNPAKISFQVKPEAARPLDLSANATGFVARDVDAPEAELEGGFALSPAAAVAGDVRILDSDRYYDGAGPVAWRSNAVAYQGVAGGPIDQVRVSVAGVARNAAVAPLMLVRPDSDAYDVQDVDVTVTRGWPSAVAWRAASSPSTSPRTRAWASAGPAVRPRPAPRCAWARRRTWATG